MGNDDEELLHPIPVNVGRGLMGVSKDALAELSDAIRKAYELIKENPNISRNGLARQTGVLLKNINNKLKLVGVIRCVGSPKHGHWEIIT